MSAKEGQKQGPQGQKTPLPPGYSQVHHYGTIHNKTDLSFLGGNLKMIVLHK